VHPSHALLEPALEAAATAAARKQQNAEANLAEDDRFDRDLGFVGAQPLDDALVRIGPGRL